MGEECDYIWKKEETEVKTEKGESHTERKLLFGMTPEFIEFMQRGELRKIDLNSIEKMYYGEQPSPEKLHLVMKDGREFNLPKWTIEEFDGLMEDLAEYAGLAKTEGPEFRSGKKDKIVKYVGIVFGAGLIILAIFALFVGSPLVLALSPDPCCWAILIPFFLFGIVSMIWLAVLMMKDQEKDKQVWESR